MVTNNTDHTVEIASNNNDKFLSSILNWNEDVSQKKIEMKIKDEGMEMKIIILHKK